MQGEKNIITLYDANNKELECEEIFTIKQNNKLYAILRPTSQLPGLKEDEAILFEVTNDSNGDQHFELVMDQELADEIYKVYLEAEEN